MLDEPRVPLGFGLVALRSLIKFSMASANFRTCSRSPGFRRASRTLSSRSSGALVIGARPLSESEMAGETAPNILESSTDDVIDGDTGGSPVNAGACEGELVVPPVATT